MTREQQNAGRLLQRAAFVAVALGAAVAKWLLLVDCYCGGLVLLLAQPRPAAPLRGWGGEPAAGAGGCGVR